jgi:hypothetical protein
MREWPLGLNRPGRSAPPPTARASLIAVSAAATAAQGNWAETTGRRLTSLEQPDREIVSEQLKHAGTRVALDFTSRFAERVFSTAFWSGVVFASLIGVTLWSASIPSKHSPATATAGAYLLIVLVAAPACHRHMRRILSTLERTSSNARRNFLKLYLLVLAASAILYCIANTDASRSAASPHVNFVFYLQEFVAFAAVTSLGSVIAYLALACGYAGALGKLASSETVGWAGALAATAFTAWLPGVRNSPLPTGNRYLDSGVLRLLNCAVTINDLGCGQVLPDARIIKSVIFDLELAAADIAQYAASRVPRTDTAVRRLARLDGLRLAWVIRDTKAPVARAVHPCNYTAPASALAGFLLAWARPGQRDFADMTRSDPTTPQDPRWRRIAARIWSAVLLAAGGIFLPLLPIYDNDQAAAAGLRYALLTAAVLSLAAQGSPAVDIIEKNLEKSIPGQANQAAS